jgi:hypothetical protein
MLTVLLPPISGQVRPRGWTVPEVAPRRARARQQPPHRVRLGHRAQDPAQAPAAFTDQHLDREHPAQQRGARSAERARSSGLLDSTPAPLHSEAPRAWCIERTCRPFVPGLAIGLFKSRGHLGRRPHGHRVRHTIPARDLLSADARGLGMSALEDPSTCPRWHHHALAPGRDSATGASWRFPPDQPRRGPPRSSVRTGGTPGGTRPSPWVLLRHTRNRKGLFNSPRRTRRSLRWRVTERD